MSVMGKSNIRGARKHYAYPASVYMHLYPNTMGIRSGDMVWLDRAMGDLLTQKERDAINYHFRDMRTLKDTASLLNISYSEVERVMTKAYTKLRKGRRL